MPFLASCGDDEDKTYTGENQVYLSAENPVIEESEATPLVVNVDLTSSYGQDITLDFKVTDDSHEILKLVDNPVTIPAGSPHCNLPGGFQPEEYIGGGYLF